MGGGSSIIWLRRIYILYVDSVVTVRTGRVGPENGRKMGVILRDGIASGRGVHRKMGVLIQKSRSNFRGFS